MNKTVNNLNQPLTDNDKLAKICERIESAQYLALDTEFTRYRTYRSQLELLQVASDEIVFCIDATCISDWTPLRQLLQAPSTTVVIHAADQDLDVLEWDDLVPREIVDTQIAALLCGESKLSYQNVVEQYLGVCLPKELTRSKWNKRPFTDGQIRYALDDVRYLLPLYRTFRPTLEQLNRSAWLKEESQKLLECPRGDDLVDEVWKNFYRGAIFSSTDQHIAKLILIWREKRAKRLNWPRQWILTDKQIADLVTDKPHTIEQTAKRIGMKSAKTPAWVSRIHTLLYTRPENSKSPIWNSWHSLQKIEKKRAVKLLNGLHEAAAAHNIPEHLLCSKQEVVDFICGSSDTRMLSGWRWPIARPVIESLNCEIQ